jgi:hypothetical protein
MISFKFLLIKFFHQPYVYLGDVSYLDNGFGLLQTELEKKVDELKEKPQSYKALHTIIEITSYAAQWSKSCREINRNIFKILMKWIDELDNSVFFICLVLCVIAMVN